MEQYIVSPDIRWPWKNEKRLPDNQKMLPLFPENATHWQRVKSIGKRREYMFQSDWIAYIPCLSAWGLIRANFVHDWASIPRVLQAITSPDGILAGAAPFHDFGYRFGGLYLSRSPGDQFLFTKMTRLELDQMFRDHNIWISELPVECNAAYYLLRAFGAVNYKNLDITKVDWSQPVDGGI